jgi:hypothetical protein
MIINKYVLQNKKDYDTKKSNISLGLYLIEGS